MNLEFNYKNIPKNNYFEYLIEEQLIPLANKFSIVNSAHVVFKVEPHANFCNNVCEIKMDTQDSSLYAIANETSIEKAIQKTSEAIETQLHDTDNT